MGQRAISYKQEIRENVDQEWHEVKNRDEQPEPHLVSLVPFPDTLQLPDHHPLGECGPILFDWLSKLVLGEKKVPMWLSSYQLLIHFQGHTGEIGLRYDRANRIWERGENFARIHGYDFNRYAAWMVAAIKAFGKVMNLQVTVQPQLPWGTTFRCWQRCLLLPASVGEFSAIDLLLRDEGISAVKKVNVFQRLQPFSLHFR